MSEITFKKGMVIRCDTEEECEQLFDILIENGFTWRGGKPLNKEDTMFEYTPNGICYEIMSTITKEIVYSHAPSKYFEAYQEGIEITQFSEFANSDCLHIKKERLIDANEFLRMPLVNGKYDKKNANKHFMFGIGTAKEMVENMPTAFDLDTFVSELVAEIRSIPLERYSSYSPYVDGQEDTCTAIINKLEELVTKHKEQHLGHCINCGESFYGKIKKDELGTHMECAECGTSFDVDDDREMN